MKRTDTGQKHHTCLVVADEKYEEGVLVVTPELHGDGEVPRVIVADVPLGGVAGAVEGVAAVVVNGGDLVHARVRRLAPAAGGGVHKVPHAHVAAVNLKVRRRMTTEPEIKVCRT